MYDDPSVVAYHLVKIRQQGKEPQPRRPRLWMAFVVLLTRLLGR